MDARLSGVSLAFLLWYVLPGINFLVIDVALPAFILDPRGVSRLTSAGNLVLIATGGLVVGFVMDSLKLYRFTWGYSAKRDEFFARLGEALSVSPDKAKKLFSLVRSLAREEDPETGFIGLDHSRWVMINHTSKCFYAFVVIWIAVTVLHWVGVVPLQYLGAVSVLGRYHALAIDGVIVLGGLLLGLRLAKISAEHLALSNENYLLFALKRADRIRHEAGLPLACAQEHR